jgi:hypothetical protein
VRSAARLVGALSAVLALAAFTTPQGHAAVLGKQRVLGVLVSYGARPYTQAQVATAVREASAFFERSSYGRMSLEPTVTPWLRANVAHPSCSGGATAIPDSLLASVRGVAAAAGYQRNDYDRVLYFIGGETCGYTGAQAGQEAVLLGPPDPRLVVHELGHTFGLPHAAGTPYCAVWCVTRDQGDLFDPMGAGFTDFGAYEKEYLGWVPRQRRVARSGAYSIDPRNAPTHGGHALVIDTEKAQFWLEQNPDRSTPGLIVRFVKPDTAWDGFIAQSTLLLAPIHEGRATITRGQLLRVPGAFSVKVGAGRKLPLRVRITLVPTD